MSTLGSTKTLSFIGVFLIGGAVACGDSSTTDSSGGAGGTATTTVTSATTSTGTTATGSTTSSAVTGSTSTGGDPCTSGADCSSCTDQASCGKCNSIAHQPGVQAYNKLLTCVNCSACYTVCDGAADTGVCTTPPATTDKCDTGTQGQQGCSTCTQCAIGSNGSCAADYTDCMNNADCSALLTDLPKCPTS